MPTLELVSREAHRLVLGGEPVEYVLFRRRGRRGVGLKVDENGLSVSAPLSVSRQSIEAFIRQSERWVKRKIVEWGARRVPEASWADGARLPLLGNELVLRRGVSLRDRVELQGTELRATVRRDTDEGVRRAVIAWYRRAALAHLAQRTFAFSRLAGLAPPRVFLSSARARWGSCNSRREVRLAWRLVKARPALVDYVVCHELAHLRHMNHSRAFWAEVARLCPEYRSLREELDATDHLLQSF